MVVLLDAGTFGGPDGTDKILLSLRERRVPVCIIACDANLAQALSEFSSDLTSQDVRKWKSTALSQ